MLSQISKGITILRKEGLSSFYTRSRDYLLRKKAAVHIYWLMQGKYISHEDKNIYAIKGITNNSRWYFPYFRGEKILRDWYIDKIKHGYFSHPIASVEEDDIVFDVGAYIGITSVMAAQKAKKVYAIEPSPRALECLRRNTKDYNNIEVLPYAIWHESDSLDLNHGVSPADDSLINPDDGGTGCKTTVQAYTVDDLASKVGVSCIDFMKVEAEGTEPEVLKGISDTEVSKISVAGNEERSGTSTYESVADILKQKKYTVDINLEHPYKTVYGYKK